MAEERKQKVRLMMTEPQPGAADALRDQLTSELGGSEAETVEVIGYARDGLEAAQMAAQLEPDVILVHEHLPGIDGYEATEMISLAAPDVASVLLVEPERLDDEGVTRRALHVGARAVLSTECDAAPLLETLHDLAALTELRNQPEYELISDPMKMPVTIAITGAKGGIGKTTIATNLAVSFARRFRDEVLLVDVYGQYGNVALMLDLSPNGNIGELASFAAELEMNIVETHLTRHQESSLNVLAGFPALIEAELAAAREHDEVAFLADLVGLLRRHYRFVFFDVPPLISNASSYIFSRCQYIMLVTGLTDLNTVRDTATLYNQLLEMRLPPERIKLIVNRASRGNELSTEDLAQAVGVTPGQIAFELPDDPTGAILSINEGVPCVISRPNSNLARGLGELADMLVGEMAEMVLETTANDG